ncbi:BAG family molecular chaperone regulator 2-like isoform X1 [Zingiber officinale]|uniref:BAG family molecular chaperone regulator 2-like isoform X1 n=1 Tax=Zingiber officinale TaxID=94328 RepID=UPI001C4C5789|nr:BAG family molecular chaperone regulator 2-like isoform X1 [Zingiber officinale]
MRSKRAETGSVAAFIPVKEFPPEKKDADWEVRPCGMLVQKRDPDGDAGSAAPVPTFRLKVKYGDSYHEICISSQATFGELKKVLSSRTGLHPLDMKLMYKDKERDSSAFLDTAGVKDKSKLVLLEDPTAQAKRLLEMRKTNKMEKAAKSISAISLEVDRLASKVIISHHRPPQPPSTNFLTIRSFSPIIDQVSALDAIVSKGGRVVENDVTNLIELLMNELIKLDSIVAEYDVKLQRRLQIKRVQKYIETLDMIKIKNRKPQQQNHQPQHQPQMHQNGNLQQQQYPIQTQTQYQQQPQQKKAVVTTNWEKFDSIFLPSTSAAAAAATTVTSVAAPTHHPRFDWELF